MKKSVVLTCRSGIEWQSVETIVRQIEGGWKKSGASIIEVQEPDELFSHHAILCQVDQIVLTQVHYFNFKAIVRFLRNVLGVKARFIVYTYGEFSQAALTLVDLRESLSSRDLFVVSCSAEMKAARLCFSNINLCCTPFPVAQKNKIGSLKSPSCQLIYAGRITQQKNLHILVQALALLRADRGPNWQLQIFGKTDGRGARHWGRPQDPDCYRRLQQLIKRLKLSGSVHFKGEVSEKVWLRQLRKQNAIFCSASTQVDENFGLAAFRALESGGVAALSGWGGHLDLAKNFPRQVKTFPPFLTVAGPSVQAQDLRDSILSLRSQSFISRLSQINFKNYSWSSHRKDLDRALGRRGRKSEALKPKSIALRLLLRQKKKRWPPSRVFINAEDALLVSFARAYGAR